MIAMMPIFERADIYENLLRCEMAQNKAPKEAFDLITEQNISIAMKMRILPENAAWAFQAIVDKY